MAIKKESKAEEIARLKNEYIEFYKELPMQKYAAMAIKRHVTTVQGWLDADEDFSMRVEAAKAEFTKKNIRLSKPEFKLERIPSIREDFQPPKQELTGDLNFNITRGKKD